MRIGTRSILFGVHQFLLHPLLAAWAWWRLYGFPFDLRLWVAFAVHDLGYWGKPNMDGPEGERHVEWGARLMGRLFGPEWADFSRNHSRFYARQNGRPFSRLCVADKYLICLVPPWLYLALSRASGELYEYMRGAGTRTPAGGPGKYAHMGLRTGTEYQWFEDVQRYVGAWCREHRDGRTDTWTGRYRHLPSPPRSEPLRDVAGLAEGLKAAGNLNP
jgi:hypothetical protein